MISLVKRIRVLLFGCPVCRHHRRHLHFCRYGQMP